MTMESVGGGVSPYMDQVLAELIREVGDNEDRERAGVGALPLSSLLLRLPACLPASVHPHGTAPARV